MEIIRKLVCLAEVVQKVIELLDRASSKHIVLLEDDEAVSDITIEHISGLGLLIFLHSISDCLVMIFTVPIASISIPYHIIAPFPSIVRNHAR
jgi:hypothetical protein